VAAALLGQPDLATGEPREEVLWMLGGRDSAARQSPVSPPQRSRIFPDSGYVVLRSPVSHAVLDAGPHGFLNGGHAHSDALSLVLSVDGQPLLIDPGTATYTADRSMRDRFRSTRMHNTVVIDGRPQSVPAGPFHWASRTDARLDFSRCSREFDYAEALHDGYWPVIHRRAVLRTAAGLWLVADHILGTDHHHIDAYWHVDPAWTRRGAVPQGVHLEHPGGLQAILASTAQSGWQEFYGDAEGLGWCAPVYGQVVPSLTFRASQDGETPISIVTAIRAATSPARLTATRLHVAADGRDGWHRTAVAVTSRDTTDVAVFAAPLPCRADEVPGRRFLQRVAVEGGELVTDGRAARLTMSEAGEPVSLLLIDGRTIMWTGKRSFDLTLGAAQDLHLEVPALRRLSRGADARSVG
jgi:hypothetical protein